MTDNLSGLGELLMNIGWMIHDLRDADKIFNEEEKLVEMSKKAKTQLESLRSQTKNDKEYILFLLQQIANIVSDGDDSDWDKLKEENEKRNIKESDWLHY